jgi:DnaJ family protein B protein 4
LVCFSQEANGTSRQESKTLSVEIKPGYKPGTKIRFPNEGDQRPNVTQDIVFVIKEKDHQYYKREGDDLVYTANITLSQALVGVKITLPTLDGRNLEVQVTDVISPNYVHRIRGEGMPSKNRGKGDLRIKFNIRFPASLNTEQKTNVKEALRNVTYQPAI